jgi:hypothetical protein
MDMELVIKQVVDHYRTWKEDSEDRDERVLRIIKSCASPLTSAELQDILAKIGEPCSRMSVQRSVNTLVKGGRIVYKGRVPRPDITGRMIYVPSYGIK